MRESLEPGRDAGLDDEFNELAGSDAQFSLVSMVATGVRHGRLILLCGLAFALLQSLRGLVGDRTYTTTTIFMIEHGSNSFNRALALASSFGLGPVADGPQLSVYLVERVLGSRPLRDSVGVRRYHVMVDDKLEPVSLPGLLEIEARNEFRRSREVRRWLEGAVRVQRDIASGIFTVRVRTRWPHVSRDVAAYLIDELNNLTIELRQSQFEDRAAFIERQLDQANAARAKAEQELLAFRKANRDFGEWSELAMDNGRLQAEFNRMHDRYDRLQAAFADAQVEALRDTPTMAVIQSPFLPRRPDSRAIALAGTAGLMGGCLMTFVAVLLIQYVKRTPSAAVGELREAWDDFAAPIPVLRRLSRP